jgi:type VI secretion system secreted protein VgrG
LRVAVPYGQSNADTAESNIYTDSLGRIKLQFPWDRYDQKNQNSSCWVRVSGEFAGNQLGSMHIPRIGQEVVVSFLGGDPDMPLVTGRGFNAVNMPHWSLPEQQALSGFRSRELIAVLTEVGFPDAQGGMSWIYPEGYKKREVRS